MEVCTSITNWWCTKTKIHKPPLSSKLWTWPDLTWRCCSVDGWETRTTRESCRSLDSPESRLCWLYKWKRKSRNSFSVDIQGANYWNSFNIVYRWHSKPLKSSKWRQKQREDKRTGCESEVEQQCLTVNANPTSAAKYKKKWMTNKEKWIRSDVFASRAHYKNALNSSVCVSNQIIATERP